MKYIKILVILFCAVSVFAQDSMQQDTTQASQLYKAALPLNKGDLSKITQLEKAVALYEKHEVWRRVIYLKSLLTLEYAWKEDDNDTLVVSTGEAAITLAKEIYQDELLPELAYAYYGIQYLYYFINKRASIPYGEKAIETLEEASEDYFKAAYFIFEAYILSNQPDKIKSLLQQLENTIQQNTEIIPSNGLLTIYYGYFQLAKLNNNPQGVIRYGLQLVQEIENKQLVDFYNIHYYYKYIGNYYGKIGQTKKGIALLKKVSKALRLPEENMNFASYNSSLSVLYAQEENYMKAIRHGLKAIEIYQLQGVDYSEIIQESYGELGFWSYQQGNYKEANQYFSTAYEYKGEDYIVDIYYAHLLNAQGKKDLALEKIQNALTQLSTTFEETDPLQNPSKYETYNDVEWTGKAFDIKTKVLYDKAKEEQSEDLFKLAYHTSQLALDVYTTMSRKNKGYEVSQLNNNEAMIQVLRMQQDVLYEWNKITPSDNRITTLFEVTERCKALTLLETLTPAKIGKEFQEALQKIQRQIRYYEQTIAVTTVTNEDSLMFYRSQLTEHTKALDDLQETIRQQYPKETETFYTTKYATLADVSAQLSEQTIWVEYAYNHDLTKLLIYVAKPEMTDIIQVPITAAFFKEVKRLPRLLKDFFLVQRTKREQFINNSHLLYQTLIAPIEKHLKGVQQVHIVPEANLFQIPFEVLLASEEKKAFHELDYLIKSFRINYHYSATTYIHLQKKPTPRDFSLLAFAPVFQEGSTIAQNTTRGIDFLVDSLYRSVDNEVFVPLPNSKVEVETISNLITTHGTTQTLLGTAATKQNLENALRKSTFQFLHIATHGLPHLTNPTLSALACYADNEANKSQVLLFANEIQMKHLAIDLVVLSSCESGIGQLIEGEGLIALNRSFIYGGAKNVLFSLWKIDDKYSSELMIDFYKAYLNEGTYAAALRTAKLNMISSPEKALPTYWAAFALIGE